MAYRLKSIRYKNSECWILLQNENGPCPLLAAANALLLRHSIHFPAHCIRNGVASLDDVTNMLANQAMMHHTSSDDDDAHFVNELLQHIPQFQYGMDVNPQFTAGITGYEYTSQLTAFDMLHVRLVHGWLVDPQEHEVYEAIGTLSYNTLVEKVIQGQEASTELERMEQQLAMHQTTQPPIDLLDDSNSEQQEQNRTRQDLEAKCAELAQAATIGSLISNFLDQTGHQLTHFGLSVLYEELQEHELVVFFRNNHFGTLTKHEGLLYLLVTDLGYANTPRIVWEKLDVIDGDTELVNHEFLRAGEQHKQPQNLAADDGPTLTPEQLLAQSGQKDADYQLALHLSRSPNAAQASKELDAQEGKLMAAATEASLRTYHGIVEDRVPPRQQQQPPLPRKEHVAIGIPIGGPPHQEGTFVAMPPPDGSDPTMRPSMSQEEVDKLLALQLQGPSAYAYHDDEASLRLAQQLQEEENRAAAARHAQTATTTARSTGRGGTASSSNCVVS